MQLLKKRGILVFWILLLADCYFIFNNQEQLRIFTKPLLIPILLFYIFLNARKQHYQTTKILVLTGFFAAWLGDILLMNKSNAFFIAGMAAFVIMHLIYAYTYYKFHKLRIGKSQEAFIAAVVMFFFLFYVV